MPRPGLPAVLTPTVGKIHDVRVPGCQAEHARTVCADQDRRFSHGLRLQAVDDVVPTFERHVGALEKGGDDLESFLEPTDARAGGLERDAGHLVVGGVPTRADAELEAVVSQQVHRRRFFGDGRGVAEVVIEDERSDLERLCGRGGGDDRGYRRQLRAEVIGNQHRREPTVLGHPSEVPPLG